MIADNVMPAMQFFVEHGYSPEQAAGIVGNLMQESGMDPAIHQIGGGGGFGLAQWTTKARKQALAAFAIDKGADVDDFRMQLEFILHELAQPGFYGARKSLQKADTVVEATTAFCNKYEIPGKPMLSSRIKCAYEAYARYLANLEGG